MLRSALVRGQILGTLRRSHTDTHIAALAIEHGAEVVSFDNDFERFDGVSWVIPGG